MNIQKHRDEVLSELNIAKQEQDEIEKKCFKLNELKEKVIIIILRFLIYVYLYILMKK